MDPVTFLFSNEQPFLHFTCGNLDLFGFLILRIKQNTSSDFLLCKNWAASVQGNLCSLLLCILPIWSIWTKSKESQLCLFVSTISCSPRLLFGPVFTVAPFTSGEFPLYFNLSSEVRSTRYNLPPHPPAEVIHSNCCFAFQAWKLLLAIQLPVWFTTQL